MVSRDSACFLRCVYCPWDSRELAIAPSPANLLQLLRESERGGPAAILFRERREEYVKLCDEIAKMYSKSESTARVRKTQALLHGTPAKGKYFAAFGSPVAGSDSLTGAQDNADATSERRLDQTANVMSAGIILLEQREQSKNAELFRPGSAFLLDEARASVADASKEAPPVQIERQVLQTGTSKHCKACDKLLCKCDVNPHNALDPKNRIHVAAIFIVRVGLISMSPKLGTVELFLDNPMKNTVAVKVSPHSESRYTVAKEDSVVLAAISGRTPFRQRLVLPIVSNPGQGGQDARFAVNLGIEYDGILGAQNVKYWVRFVRKK